MNLLRFAAVALLSLPVLAHADTFSNFQLNGTFGNPANPYSAFGVITVNTTTGAVTNVNLGTTQSNYAGATSSFSAFSGSYSEITETWMSGGSFVNSLNLIIPTSLVGYTGGQVCSLYYQAGCGGGSTDSYLSPSNTQSFITASLAPTPEPSSLMLLGTGVAGLLGLAKRRFRGQQA